MSDRDNITLPREVAEHLTKMLEECPLLPNDDWSERDCAALTALRARLDAPRPEPVADEEAPRLWAWMREGWSADCGPWYEVIRNDQMTWRDRKEWTPLYTPPAAAPEPVRVEPTPPITRFTCGFVDVRFNGDGWFCEMCGERMNEHYEEMVKHSNGKDYLELMQRKAAFKMGRDKT